MILAQFVTSAWLIGTLVTVVSVLGVSLIGLVGYIWMEYKKHIEIKFGAQTTFNEKILEGIQEILEKFSILQSKVLGHDKEISDIKKTMEGK